MRGITVLCRVAAIALLVGCGNGDTNPTDTPDPPAPTAATVDLSTTSVTFDALRATERITATVRDQNGDVMAGAPVTWSSSESAVATVTSIGVVTAQGNGTATLTATSGSATADAQAEVDQRVTTLVFSPDPVVLAAPGDTTTVGVSARDANGWDDDDAQVAWATDDATVVTVSPDGLATAAGGGTATISATVDSVSGTADVFVGGQSVTITGVQPAVLIEGDSAVIAGTGFAATPGLNTVTVDGLQAVVTAASATSLSIVVPESNCHPPRLAGLEVATPTEVSATTVDLSPAVVRDLDLGAGVFSTDRCIHLAAATGAEAYLIGALSVSEAPSSLTAATLRSRSASTAPPPVVVAPAGSGASVRLPAPRMRPASSTTSAASPWARELAPLDRSGEAEIRRIERELFERLERSGERPDLASQAAFPQRISPNQGDTISVNVPEGCSDHTVVRAVTRLVGTDAIWLEDIANPTESFTTSEYQAFDQTLSQATLPVLHQYFGDFEDIDGNGKIVILVTKEVNEREVLGFAWSVDLVGQQNCPGGNGAEIFYGYTPDPAGDFGRAYTKAEVLASYDALIAHETTHVIQGTERIFRGAGSKSSWETEGGATLAEQLVGYAVLGHGSGQDLGRAEFELGIPGGWYRDWAGDMRSYFGWLGGSSRAAGAPEECSWVGRESEGNTGPCWNGRAPYGVPSTLLRYVLDWHGPSYPGGEAGLMRELTSSPFGGFEALEQATGDSREKILTEFAITLWADGRLADWLPSWDVFDVFQGFSPSARLAPYASSEVEPELSPSVRAGSSAYLEWSPPVAHETTSLRLRTPADTELPPHMILWVVRIQ